MKTLAALLMSLHVWLATLAPGGLMELVRLPGLSEHYNEHLIESGGALSVVDFLVLHYCDVEHERRDGQRHTDLPFHHSIGSMLCYIPHQPVPTLSTSEVPTVQVHPEARSWACGEWSGRSVFHPPKLIG